jgi:hypothetical protein
VGGEVYISGKVFNDVINAMKYGKIIINTRINIKIKPVVLNI